MSHSKIRPILYVKYGCPWCRDALTYFDGQGVELDVRDVNTNPQDMSAMVSVSGQTKAPTFVYKDCIVADFSVDEFINELNDFPHVRHDLALSEE
jgi:glutaredoxin